MMILEKDISSAVMGARISNGTARDTRQLRHL